MKIGHYMRDIWENGGVASYIRRVATEQVSLGHEVVFLDSVPPPDKNYGFDVSSFVQMSDEKKLYEYAAEKQVDVLHVHKVLPRVSKISLPTIRTLHGHQPYCPSSTRYFKRSKLPCGNAYNLLGCIKNHFSEHCGTVRPQRMLSNFAETWDEMSTLRSIPTLTVSKFLKEQMKRSGYAEEMISVLYLPSPQVGEVPPPPRQGTPHFVFLGRISPAKGVEWLLRATKEARTEFHVDIAGTGYDDQNMRALSSELGLDDRVTFHGWVDERAVFNLLSNARALVFPSLWHEPGGTVAFEAMVNGRAVIMSKVGGMPEVVLDNVNGLIVEPFDVHGMAAAIDDLATDWEKAKRLGDEGREMSKNYTLRSHTETLLGHYDQCIVRFGRKSVAMSPVS